MLCTSEGLPVLSSDGNELVLGPEYDPTKITVDGDGNLLYPSEENNNNPTAIGLKIDYSSLPIRQVLIRQEILF